MAYNLIMCNETLLIFTCRMRGWVTFGEPGRTNACAKCPGGTYSTRDSATTQDQCKKCGPNTVTPPNDGGKSITDCRMLHIMMRSYQNVFNAIVKILN